VFSIVESKLEMSFMFSSLRTGTGRLNHDVRGAFTIYS